MGNGFCCYSKSEERMHLLGIWPAEYPLYNLAFLITDVHSRTDSYIISSKKIRYLAKKFRCRFLGQFFFFNGMYKFVVKSCGEEKNSVTNPYICVKNWLISLTNLEKYVPVRSLYSTFPLSHQIFPNRKETPAYYF